MCKLSIKAKHPVRAAVSSLPDYFEYLNDAVAAIRAELSAHGLRCDDFIFHGSEGFTTATIRPEPNVEFVCGVCEDKLDCAAFDNVVAVSYYRLDSGRWEVIKYIS